MRFVIVTGMSGAGKSSALKTLEDAGYFCVDNLPVALLDKFADMLLDETAKIENVALGIDIRNGRGIGELAHKLKEIEAAGIKYEILYLNASNRILLKRYKETRRNHPLSRDGRVEDGIAKEREIMKFLQDQATYVIDTSQLLTRELKEEIGKLVPTDDDTLKIVGDLVCPNDFVILVVPIDSAAPKGRLILPQQQTIRDLLEAGAASIVVRETELEKTLEEIGKKPALVITDSQAFGKVSKIVPEDIKLTSFSILFARYKGDLEEEVRGVKALEHLEEGAKILIAEGCTHHRQCDDIGTVKIPRWLKQYTGKDFDIHTSSGNSFPEDLDTYDLVIHCGGCTLNRREMKNRIARVKDAGVPIVNYGIFIAATQGILKRTLEPFEEASRILNEI